MERRKWGCAEQGGAEGSGGAGDAGAASGASSRAEHTFLQTFKVCVFIWHPCLSLSRVSLTLLSHLRSLRSSDFVLLEA